MIALYDAASDLEKSSVQANHQECERSLAKFRSALAQVCQSIEDSLELTERTQPDQLGTDRRSEAINIEAVSGIIKELARLARLNHLDSITYLDSVKKDLTTLGLADDLRKLEEAVENTDFEQALQILNRFAESIGFTIEV
jgi:hypothetical protein